MDKATYEKIQCAQESIQGVYYILAHLQEDDSDNKGCGRQEKNYILASVLLNACESWGDVLKGNYPPMDDTTHGKAYPSFDDAMQEIKHHDRYISERKQKRARFCTQK